MNATKSAVGSAAIGPITRLVTAWQGISPRERRLVLIAGAVVAVGLTLSLLDWTRHERARLDRSLPRSAAQLEQVQESATEIARLRTQPPLQAPAGPALLEAAQTSAKSRGLGLTLQAGGEGLHVKGQAPFDELVTWLAAVQRDQGLRVLRMEIQQQGPQASIDAVLAGPSAP
ncbi:type II secretion system protein GspM [Zoogloea sp. LCSB751]|uniref:type II secretion system protein GspM n=1 Tax=Zoogloea sp. LCSB751 TaxID=1965277 RepID=UPI0009A4D0AE|nr:type II secretion system protein GspM [Zoogloea sp. LCSB751]